MSGRHMNARPKRLTRKQKEALSAQGWDFRLYLCVRDAPDFMELVNRDPYGAGWLMRVSGAVPDGLLDAAGYQAVTESA